MQSTIISHAAAWARGRNRKLGTRSGSVLADQLTDGQQRVHRPGTKAFEIKRHELETQGLEDAREFRGHFGREGARHLLGRDLDANDVSVMADPELTESK